MTGSEGPKGSQQSGPQQERPHLPAQEYLETIHSLLEEGTPVIQARIAQRLGRSAASVSEMLDRLADEGYVRRADRLVELTERGAALAAKVVRRHRLAECFLVDVIGLPWRKVHQEASVWEHVISDDVEERLVAILGNPLTCPHGNPIPGAPQPVSNGLQRPLSEVQAGTLVRLERMTEEVEVDMMSLIYLDDHGFLPGTVAFVSSRAPDGTLTLQVGDTAVAFGSDLSARLFVAAL
ncbi:MAG: metal-dependent transcriptional regulator [Acidimicrobiales bacterium]